MNKILSAAIFLFIFLTAEAQDPKMDRLERRFEAQRVAYITERLDLSPEEAGSFWPIYNEFRNQEKEIKGNQRMPDLNFENLTENEADRMIADMLKRDQQLVDLKKEYMARLKNVVPSKKVAMLPHLENEFRREVLSKIRGVKDRRAKKMQKRKLP